MDYYKKKIIRNVILAVIFVIGVILQIVGRSIESYTGLALQGVSLVLLLIALFTYNRRFR